jgi:phosphodiesterase/alkaline phosphatase D-like protein
VQNHFFQEGIFLMTILVGPLVRAVSSTCATIWVEISRASLVTLQVQSTSNPEQTFSVNLLTLSVGGHFYAAPQLPSLLPFTLYTYKLIISTQDNSLPKSTISSDFYTFRTLPAKQALTGDVLIPSDVTPSEALLRLAYGSCRKLANADADTLSAYGDWLLEHVSEQERYWPQVLLLIGDQIYADQPPPDFQEASLPMGQEVARSFEDFAALYRYVWTNSQGIRYLLAHISTYMIFDDHEITNDWNLFPGWRVNALREGQEQLLIDGMVAYWIYQGWGNLLPENETPNPLLEITRQAQQSGIDALERLRDCIREEVYGRTVLPWHYTIPTTPAIFVSNARAERSTSFSSDEDEFCISTRIMSSTQMESLKNWLHMQPHQPALLVSSVPVLLPPLIGLAEYIMGIRPFQQSRFAFLRKLGLELARRQLRLAIGTSFDHWPTFAETWQELRQALLERPSDVLILSGDVHFSYAATARPLWQKRPFRLYQFVCSPFENELSKGNRLEILLQSFFARGIYSGLSTRILPMRKHVATAQITRRHLFQRAIAVVTLQAKSRQDYAVYQEYLGIAGDKFQVIASTTLSKGEKKYS